MYGACFFLGLSCFTTIAYCSKDHNVKTFREHKIEVQTNGYSVNQFDFHKEVLCIGEEDINVLFNFLIKNTTSVIKSDKNEMMFVSGHKLDLTKQVVVKYTEGESKCLDEALSYNMKAIFNKMANRIVDITSNNEAMHMCINFDLSYECSDNNDSLGWHLDVNCGDIPRHLIFCVLRSSFDKQKTAHSALKIGFVANKVKNYFSTGYVTRDTSCFLTKNCRDEDEILDQILTDKKIQSAASIDNIGGAGYIIDQYYSDARDTSIVHCMEKRGSDEGRLTLTCHCFCYDNSNDLDGFIKTNVIQDQEENTLNEKSHEEIDINDFDDALLCDRAVLLKALQCLLKIADQNGCHDLIDTLKLREVPCDLNKKNVAETLQCAGFNEDCVIRALKEFIASHKGTCELGEDLLSLAMPFCNNKLIELLVNSEVDVNSLDADKNTALYKAVMHGNIGIVNILLNAGAKVESINVLRRSKRMEGIATGFGCTHKNVTAMYMAILCNNIRMIKVLLDHKASPNFHAEHMYTPLQNAVNDASVPIIKLLLQFGADIGEVDTSQDNVVQRTIWYRSKAKFVIALIDGADKDFINVVDRYGFSLLQRAILNGSTELIQILINKGADFKYISQDGDSLMHIALSLQCLGVTGENAFSILKILIDAGSDVNCRNQKGFTPLMLAVSHGCFLLDQKIKRRVISLLVRSGACLNMLDNKQNTALHHIANLSSDNACDIALFLLKHGARSDIKNIDNETAEELSVNTLKEILSNAHVVPPTLKTLTQNRIIKQLSENSKETKLQKLREILITLQVPEILIGEMLRTWTRWIDIIRPLHDCYSTSW